MLHVNFKAYNNYVTDSLYQWDKNIELIVNGLNLAVAPEIHFANANMDRAIVRQSTINGGAITVKIPNSLLQEALTIKAYVGVYEGDTFKVIETIEIPVIARKRPYDYTIEDTDEEIYSFNKLETLIENMAQENENLRHEIEDSIGEKINEAIDETVDNKVDEKLSGIEEIIGDKIDEKIDGELLTDLQEMIAKLDVAIPLMADAWVENEDTYTQTVAVEGLKANDHVIILLSTVGAEATDDELNAYACLLDETIVEDGSITFIASEIPSISFTVIAKGVATSENQAIADVTALVAKTNELENEIDKCNNVLSNKFAVVETTTLPDGVGNNWSVPYPEGFNISNCVMLEALVYTSNSWMINLDVANRSCGLKENGIGGYQNDNYPHTSAPFKIALMRTDI